MLRAVLVYGHIVERTRLVRLEEGRVAVRPWWTVRIVIIIVVLYMSATTPEEVEKTHRAEPLRAGGVIET